MGTKAFLQKGRGKPGLILPANAVAKINEASDRSALIRAADRKAKPIIDVAAEIEHVKNAVTATLAVPKEMLEPELVEAAPPAKPKRPEPEDEKTVVVPNPFVDDTVVTPNPFVDDADTQPDDTEPDQKAPHDLTQIPGVGPALQARLHNFGYRSFQQIASADPAVLNEIPGAKGRGDRWVTEARKLLDA